MFFTGVFCCYDTVRARHHIVQKKHGVWYITHKHTHNTQTPEAGSLTRQSDINRLIIRPWHSERITSTSGQGLKNNWQLRGNTWTRCVWMMRRTCPQNTHQQQHACWTRTKATAPAGLSPNPRPNTHGARASLLKALAGLLCTNWENHHTSSTYAYVR